MHLLIATQTLEFTITKVDTSEKKELPLDDLSNLQTRIIQKNEVTMEKSDFVGCGHEDKRNRCTPVLTNRIACPVSQRT